MLGIYSQNEEYCGNPERHGPLGLQIRGGEQHSSPVGPVLYLGSTVGETGLPNL